MDTLTFRVPHAQVSAPASSDDLPAASRIEPLRHPVIFLQRLFVVEFDLGDCVLCDEASLHTDLANLFERSDAPTARPNPTKQ